MFRVTHPRSARSNLGYSSEAQRVKAGDGALSKMTVQLMKSMRSMLRKWRVLSLILTRSTRTRPATRLRLHTLTPCQSLQVSRPLRLRQKRLHLPFHSRLRHKPKLSYSPHRLELLRGPGRIWLSIRIFLVTRGPDRVHPSARRGITLTSRRRQLDVFPH
jgi:hypothetical protein